MRKWLFSTLLTRPTYSPADIGAGAGAVDGTEPNPDDLFDPNEDGELLNADSNDPDKITVDDSTILSELFPATPETLLDDDFDGEAVRNQLATQLTADIEAFSISEDMIPDNFDPRDPKQFRDVMGAIAQSVIRHTVGATLKPVQAGIERSVSGTERLIKNELIKFKQAGSTESDLVKAIPIAADPARRSVIDPIFQRALKHHNGDRAKAIQSTIKGLNAIGINPNKLPTDSKKSASRSSGLDAFLPLPSTQQRMKK